MGAVDGAGVDVAADEEGDAVDVGRGEEEEGEESIHGTMSEENI